MEKTDEKRRHSFSLDARSKGSMTGVGEVLSCGDDELCLSTGEGLLTVTGKGLKIVRFSTEDGSLSFTGEVASIKYGAAKVPLVKRIFK